MLETVTLYGNISEINSICGSLNLPTEYIEPKTEQLIIEPKKEQQIFEPNVGKYYDKVTVESVSAEQIEVMSSNIDKIIIPANDKFIDKVIVKGDENLIAENIRKDSNIFGVVGTMEGAWDTSQIRGMYSMFGSNTTMTEAPYFDTSNVINMSYTFSGCSSLESVPLYNTSKVTNMSGMFNGCSKLKEIPLFDTSNVTTITSMFYRCRALTSIPQIDVSNISNLTELCRECSNLKTFPQLNTSKVMYFTSAFYYCSSLTTIPLLDFSKCQNLTSTFYNCTSLTTLEGFKELGKNYSTTNSANFSNYTLNLSYSTNLTETSLINVLNNLYDIATKGCNIQQVIIGATNLAKLTVEEIAIATNKGWTVS